jgi:hypothetical protein
LKATIPAYQRAKADIKFTQTKKVRLDVWPSDICQAIYTALLWQAYLNL